MFPDHNEIKLEINSRKIHENSLNVRLTKIKFLNGTWVKKKIRRTLESIINGVKIKTQHVKKCEMPLATTVVPKGNTALNIYIRKEEWSHSSRLSIYIKKQEKENQIKQNLRRKGIRKIRMETNETETENLFRKSIKAKLVLCKYLKWINL